MKVTFQLDTTDSGDKSTLQKFIDVLRDADVPAVPDALESIMPEPPVDTTPAPEELSPQIPEPPAAPEAPHPAPMAPPAPAGFEDVDDDPTPPAAAVADDATPETDNQGLPWDGRIHASSKLMTTKGNWKRRRGVEDKVYNQVVAELTAGATAVAQETEAAAETEAVLAEVPPVPETPDPATAGFGGNGAAGEMTWPDLVQKVMTAKVQELVSQEQLDNTCANLGVQGGFNNLVGRPDLYERFVMELNL